MSPLHRARGLVRRLLRGEPTPLERWNAMQAQLGASAGDRAIVDRARPYTMTGPARLQSLLDAVAYLTVRGIGGAFVECGVWRGGSALAIVLKLLELGVTDRDLYLYDTFEGMTAPTASDTSAFEAPAAATWAQAESRGERAWGHLFEPQRFNEAAVRQLLLDTGYPAERLHFVRGAVEQTIPGVAPERIALLRLDTDWYESTRHELAHLYPRVPRDGVLIVDDYGHWDGCRKAVDEYFLGRADAPLLVRVDYSARIAVKP